MRKDREPINQPQPENWKERDELFFSFLDQSYGGHLSKKQMENARRQKLDGDKLKNRELYGIVAKMVIFRLTPKRLQARNDELLSKLTDEEKATTELTLGLNFCGQVPDREKTADILHLQPQKLDSLLKSATEKLQPQKRK